MNTACQLKFVSFSQDFLCLPPPSLQEHISALALIGRFLLHFVSVVFVLILFNYR